MAMKLQIDTFRKEKSPGGSSEAHSKLLNDVLLAVSAAGHARVWRNESGMAKNYRTGTPFKYGLVGSADILGILKNGKFLAIEIKTGEATQSKEQKSFAAMIQKFNGLFCCTQCERHASFYQTLLRLKKYYRSTT